MLPPNDKLVFACLAVGFTVGLITGVALMLNVHSDLVVWYTAYGKN